jgi:hypothetical protein
MVDHIVAQDKAESGYGEVNEKTRLELGRDLNYGGRHQLTNLPV